MLRYFVIRKCEVIKGTLHAAELCDPEACSEKNTKTKHRMVRYSVILKCQLLEKKTPHAAELCDTKV